MWNCESQFADSFEGYLLKYGTDLQRRGKDAVVLREYDPGYGRVDLVLVVYDIKRLQKRRQKQPCSSDCAELDLFGAYAMAYLTQTRWVSIKRLGLKLNIEVNRAQRLVADLKRRGLIEIASEFVKANARQKNWVIDRVETFELKLVNWKRALEQASRHLWFASRSYVVMPGCSEKIVDQLVRDCNERSVGAILCGDQNNWQTLSRPPRMAVPTSHIGWILNEAIISSEVLVSALI